MAFRSLNSLSPLFFSFLTLLLLSPLFAEETENRTWTANTGHTAQGVVITANEESVTLRLSNGQEVELGLFDLIEDDREFLADHFDFHLPDPPPLPVQFSGEPALTNLEQNQGQIVGPIEVEDDANVHYFLYLPTTLVQGRDAPMLVHSSPASDHRRILNQLTEAAERYGMILCTCIEARNQMQAGLDRAQVTIAMMTEVMEKYPVDHDRLYFTGSSGGGAFSVFLADAYDGVGVMPLIAYIPAIRGGQMHAILSTELPTSPKDWYWIGGGSDYNRYTTAAGRLLARNDGFHHVVDGGHGGGDNRNARLDGLHWMMARWFGREGRNNRAEQLDFEARSLLWLHEIKEDLPYMAYHRAIVLQENLDFSPAHAPLLQALIGELETTQANVLYRQGLLAIDEFSQDQVAPLGTSSKKRHLDEGVSREAIRLQEEYQGVPVIPDLFRSLSERSCN